MTLLTLSIAALALGSPPALCSIAEGSPPEQRVFTNADLDRMASCRYQTGAESKPGTVARTSPSRSGRGAAGATARDAPRPDPAEADWRAQWRSIDQKARRLRREARELRQEALEAPRDPKKRPTGRRSPSLLITRALALEAEAKELEDEFQDRARRAGALPGWLRPRTR
jgi:hypothetical protein